MPLSPIGVLQESVANASTEAAIRSAAETVSFPRLLTDEQSKASVAVNRAVCDAIIAVVQHSPVSQERSRAIAALREARMWANSAIALKE